MVLDVDTMNNEGICFHSIKRIYDKRGTYCPCIKVEEFLLIDCIYFINDSGNYLLFYYEILTNFKLKNLKNKIIILGLDN